MENTEELTHKFYETKAQEFSNTRYKTWPKIKQFLSNTNGLLLDAGCGNGRNMPENSLGIDFSLGLLKQARKKDINNEYIQADVLKLPFNDDIFGNILSIAVIHHLNTHERRVMAMKEMYRVLKSDGYLLIYVWDKDSVKGDKFKKINEYDYMVDWKKTGCMRYYPMFDLKSFERFIKATNFKILEIGVEQENLYAKLQE